MNTAVEPQSGPFITAATCWPSQLSPAAMENPLCSEFLSLPGVSTENAGSLPVLASAANWPSAAMPEDWPYRHSANEGQIAHQYPRDWVVDAAHVSRPLA